MIWTEKRVADLAVGDEVRDMGVVSSVDDKGDTRGVTYSGPRGGGHGVWPCHARIDVRTSDDYRIALRPYGDDEGGEKWKDALDDIVVNDVSMFRMEDMGEWFFMCCYLNGKDAGDRIAFSVRRGRKGEPHVVVNATELPDVVYEDGSITPDEP